jgi:predicted RND superfamily exporter protein
MYYHTPNVSRYVNAVRRFRALILSFFIILTVVVFNLAHFELISSDTLYWLSESTEYQKTKSQAYKTAYVTRLTIDVPRFDDHSKNLLVALQGQLANQKGVLEVDSLVSSHRIYQEGTQDSAMVKALAFNELNASIIKSFIQISPGQYERFVDKDFKHFYFTIESTLPIDYSQVKIPYTFHTSAAITQGSLRHYAGYAVIFIFMTIVMSRWLFKNYIAAIGVLSVTIITMVLTFGLIELISKHHQIHIAMTLMVLSVSIGHFLYFYYRWHVSHFKNDSKRAIEKSIDRNLSPALWTLPVLAVSLGTLLFIDSVIIQMLSLSLLLSSAIAYCLNLTFLPALLSYFSVKHPRVGFARMCYGFANREIHYRPKLLQLFIFLTFAIMIVVFVRFWGSEGRLFDARVDDQTIMLKIPFHEIDLSLLKKLQKFDYDLRYENIGVAKVDSIQNVLNQFDLANSANGSIDEQRILQALFFLELYDMEKKYIDGNALKIIITLENSDHSSIIRWLEGYRELPLYFTDLDTLSESAKMDKRAVLASSLVSALIMICIVMGLIFRSVKIGFVGFVANVIPVIWFGLFMILFNVTLSIEVLIAMAISVGLTSDTIIHFAYKYLRSRYFGRTKKHALEIMFFYAGVPAIIGAIVLMAVFGLLSLTGLETLTLIGGYGVVLMLFSLISDLFILPVLLLALDKKEDINRTHRG